MSFFVRFFHRAPYFEIHPLMCVSIAVPYCCRRKSALAVSREKNFRGTRMGEASWQDGLGETKRSALGDVESCRLQQRLPRPLLTSTQCLGLGNMQAVL